MLSCSFVEALKLQVINSATAAAQLVAYYSFSRSKGWTADLVRADSLALAQAVGVENKFPENVFSWRCRFCSFHTTHSNWKHVRVHLGNQGDAFIFSRPKVLVNVNEMAVRLLKVKGEYKGTREGSSARKVIRDSTRKAPPKKKRTEPVPSIPSKKGTKWICI
ncbi:hypothetical protein CDL15_Pgr019482 [Punica granatum]|uniref:Uncharacterized protein n=1 Tax=Punica granatum TaxID=22663 RepID=A0A218VUF5_PUNGR|nr:hypothetical protein CDL15_Pgr019482 [Punica granatum]